MTQYVFFQFSHVAPKVMIIEDLSKSGTNYIIFKNVENFKNIFFLIKNIVMDNSEYLGIFHLLK